MNAGVHQRCRICRCYLDATDLFCANCGTENPAGGRPDGEQSASHVSFDCNACGASMVYDATATQLKCPYCGATAAKSAKQVRSTVPEIWLPFEIDQNDAQRRLTNWLGRGFWRPSDLRKAARVGKIKKVLVPYWLFSAEVKTRFTADTSPPPPGRPGDWQPVFGQRHERYSGLMVSGSNVLTAIETQSISPFDISRGRALRGSTGSGRVGQSNPRELGDFQDAVVEQFRAPRKLARPVVREQIIRSEKAAIGRELGRCRNVRVNVELAALEGKPILVPLWIIAYSYKSEVHRVLINGQTGKVSGSAPFATGKLILVVLAIVAVLFLAGLMTIIQR